MKVDERVIGVRDKINSKAFEICYIGLWLMISYRMFVLKQSPSEYGDIFILAVIVSAFVVINMVLKGVFTSTPKVSNKLSTVVLNVLYIISFILIFIFLTGMRDPIKIGVGVLIVIIIRFSPLILSKISSKKAEKDLEE